MAMINGRERLLGQRPVNHPERVGLVLNVDTKKLRGVAFSRDVDEISGFYRF